MATYTRVYTEPQTTNAGREVLMIVADTLADVAAAIDEVEQDDKALVTLTAATAFSGNPVSAGETVAVSVRHVVWLEEFTA